MLTSFDLSTGFFLYISFRYYKSRFLIIKFPLSSKRAIVPVTAELRPSREISTSSPSFYYSSATTFIFTFLQAHLSSSSVTSRRQVSLIFTTHAGNYMVAAGKIVFYVSLVFLSVWSTVAAWGWRRHCRKKKNFWFPPKRSFPVVFPFF